jgi:hypothetical protein
MRQARNAAAVLQVNDPELVNEDIADGAGLQSTIQFRRTPLYAQTVGCPEFVEELDKIELEIDLNRAQREIGGSHSRSYLRGGGDEKLWQSVLLAPEDAGKVARVSVYDVLGIEKPSAGAGRSTAKPDKKGRAEVARMQRAKNRRHRQTTRLTLSRDRESCGSAGALSHFYTGIYYIPPTCCHLYRTVREEGGAGREGGREEGRNIEREGEREASS